MDLYEKRDGRYHQTKKSSTLLDQATQHKDGAEPGTIRMRRDWFETLKNLWAVHPTRRVLTNPTLHTPRKTAIFSIKYDATGVLAYDVIATEDPALFAVPLSEQFKLPAVLDLNRDQYPWTITPTSKWMDLYEERDGGYHRTKMSSKILERGTADSYAPGVEWGAKNFVDPADTSTAKFTTISEYLVQFLNNQQDEKEVERLYVGAAVAVSIGAVLLTAQATPLFVAQLGASELTRGEIGTGFYTALMSVVGGRGAADLSDLSRWQWLFNFINKPIMEQVRMAAGLFTLHNVHKDKVLKFLRLAAGPASVKRAGSNLETTLRRDMLFRQWCTGMQEVNPIGTFWPTKPVNVPETPPVSLKQFFGTSSQRRFAGGHVNYPVYMLGPLSLQLALQNTIDRSLQQSHEFVITLDAPGPTIEGRTPGPMISTEIARPKERFLTPLLVTRVIASLLDNLGLKEPGMRGLSLGSPLTSMCQARVSVYSEELESLYDEAEYKGTTAAAIMCQWDIYYVLALAFTAALIPFLVVNTRVLDVYSYYMFRDFILTFWQRVQIMRGSAHAMATASPVEFVGHAAALTLMPYAIMKQILGLLHATRRALAAAPHTPLKYLDPVYQAHTLRQIDNNEIIKAWGASFMTPRQPRVPRARRAPRIAE